MKSGNIFWGILLIVLGALIFMRNFDIFFFSWGSILHLWPLLFVFWGISVFPIKSGAKLILSIATVILGFILLASSPHKGFFWNNNWNKHERVEYDKDYDNWEDRIYDNPFDDNIQYAKLNFNAAAGSYQVNGTTDQLFRFKTEGNGDPYKVNVVNIDNDEVEIDFRREKVSGSRNMRNNVYMYLNDSPLWSMHIDAGAAELEMDLSAYRVEEIEINGGAAEIDLKLGERYDHTTVNIEAGAAEMTIHVPEASACEIITRTILTDRNFDGFNKISKGVYQTPNFSDSANQILIEVKAAVSELNIVRY